jgi:hypothetical protein
MVMDISRFRVRVNRFLFVKGILLWIYLHKKTPMRLWFGIMLSIVLIMPGKVKALLIQDIPVTNSDNILYPPVNLVVDTQTLEAAWLPPGAAFNQMEEHWDSLDFETNEWTFEPSQGNWQIDTLFGNPSPSARFKWSPGLNNYNHALVSKELNGMIMPNTILQYDLHLDNYSSSTLEELTVEVFAGSAWISVMNHSNAAGSIPWSTHTFDISGHVTGQMFRIRFRASGVNSASINWWSIDNINVYADISGGDDEELLGYYVYMDDVVVAFTDETSFNYDPLNFTYGGTYTAAVSAVYDAGFSAPVLFEFVSGFLFKPCNLHGNDINHAVALYWEAPGTCEPGGIAVPTSGYKIYRDNNLIATTGNQVFSFIDEPLIAGFYDYTITALYPYNNGLVESLPAGPVNIRVEPGAGFVVGTVTDAITSDSIAGVIVSAGIYTTYTLDDGSYWLVAPEGIYDIVYNKPGYALHVIGDFEIVWQQTHEIDVELTPTEPNIPFGEHWDSEDFETNGWTFEPGQGNWLINALEGSPAPCVEFNYTPAAVNYSYALISQELDARSFTENLILHFDLYLLNYAPTGNEKMRVDVWSGNEWTNIAEFSNLNSIPWTNYAIDITSLTAGRFTRLRFVAHGQNSFNIDNWRIDNISVALASSISVNPKQIQTSLHIGVIYDYPLNISNTGAGLLEYNIIPVFRRDVPVGEPIANQGLQLDSNPNPRPGREPSTGVQENEIILHYDGPNFDAIGLVAGGTFLVASRFPSSLVGQYAGYKLESVDVYINDLPTNLVLKIWGAGTANTPGMLLAEQIFNPSAYAWNTIQLVDEVTLDGSDIWVGYEVTHDPQTYPAGTDAGPADPNGDWISIDGTAWEHLAGYGLNYNWNIRACIAEGMPSWLTTDPVSGEIPSDSLHVVDVIFNTTGLNGYSQYSAELFIYSNDPLQPLVIVPVDLSTVNYLPEIVAEAWVICYPVPSGKHLNIMFKQEVAEFRILNQAGQVVVDSNSNGRLDFTIDVSHLPSGLYFLQADARDGKVYSRKIIISR